MNQTRRNAGAPWAPSKYGFSMALVRPKGLLLHGETASVDAASSQSNQRSFQFIMGRQAVERSDRSLWPDLQKFHGGVFACDAVARRLFSPGAILGYHTPTANRRSRRIYSATLLLTDLTSTKWRLAPCRDLQGGAADAPQPAGRATGTHFACNGGRPDAACNRSGFTAFSVPRTQFALAHCLASDR